MELYASHVFLGKPIIDSTLDYIAKEYHILIVQTAHYASYIMLGMLCPPPQKKEEVIIYLPIKDIVFIRSTADIYAHQHVVTHQPEGCIPYFASKCCTLTQVIYSRGA